MAKKSLTISTVVAISLLCLGVGIGGGYLTSYYLTNNSNMRKIKAIYDTLNKNWLYVDDHEDIDDYLTNLAIKGMTNNGDPYTLYTGTMEEQGLSTNEISLGVNTTFYNGGLIVNYVNTKSVAYEVGILKGDIITKVNKNDGIGYIDLKDLDIDKRSAYLSGEVNKTYKYIIKRGEEEKEFSCTFHSFNQDAVVLNSFKQIDNKNIVNVEVKTFLGDVYNEMQAVLDGVITKYTHIDTLIIDLRDNGGGYVDQALNTLDLFVDKGLKLMTYKYSKGREQTMYSKTSKKYNVPDIRLIMNEYTASASETFAVGLMDILGAKAYGKKSYGKGIAQSYVQLFDGSVLKYTFAKTYGPNDYSIHGVGIIPQEKYTIDYGGATLRSFVKPNIDNDLLYPNEKTHIKKQISYISPALHGTFDEMIFNLQKMYSLTESKLYDKETFDYLTKRLYDLYLTEYDETTLMVLNNGK